MGNNEFGLTFLLFSRVCLDIFVNIFNIIFYPRYARAENNIENVEQMSRQTWENSKKIDPNPLLPLSNQPNNT